MGGGGSCALSSGTSALYVALRVLEVGPGDVVAVPTFSCAALLDAVFAVGARPLAVDVSRADMTMDPESLAHLRTRSGKPLSATIAVHTHGARAPVEDLIAAGSAPVIQDCAHSIGGRWNGRFIGHEGTLSIFSFYATKIVTCGQGGLLHDPAGELAAAGRELRDHRPDPYTPRFNVALTDFQAALARSQLTRLEAIAQRRREIARAYLGALPPAVPAEPGVLDDERLVHRFAIRADDAEQRARWREHFSARGIETGLPVAHGDLLHDRLRLDRASYPVAEELADTILSLPLYPALGDDQVMAVCAALAALAA
jgi:dTDP-4-amino-4,6-dideoxygalactose transaminase